MLKFLIEILVLMLVGITSYVLGVYNGYKQSEDDYEEDDFCQCGWSSVSDVEDDFLIFDGFGETPYQTSIDNKFKAGDTVVNIASGEKHVVLCVPGDKKYDDYEFSAANEGFLTTSPRTWQYQSHWELFLEAPKAAEKAKKPAKKAAAKTAKKASKKAKVAKAAKGKK